SRVSVFHMDEYLGLAPDASQRFGRFLSDRLFNSVKPGQVYLIDSANTVDAEIRRYSALLAAAPIDIVCLGIGENGHIAFNDPGAAVRHALRGPITTACPASILRLHPSCILFLDRDSSDLS
ncbi:MAG TPA: 6-phosphogluconolactonase, partial [Ktedonobacteraceae bacterium]|nr:6-phosphogluconolactonase [Ktedonobacteraceae bacterium]